MPRRSLFFRILSVAVVLIVAILFALLIGDAFLNEGKPLTTFVPKGKYADDIFTLIIPVFAIAGLVFVGVMGAVLFITWKFKERDTDDPDEFPGQTHGNTVLELGWTILPALILVGIAIGTVITIVELNREPEDAIEVKVTGQQWWWQYQYDIDGDGSYDGPQDITTATELVIPTGREIALTVTSNDVIHSFWIPALNGKKDAVPGLTSPLNMQADEPGIYRGQCTEFCGLSHANMRMLVRAVEGDQFEAWVENQQKDHAAEPTSEMAQEGRTQFEALCAQCHVIRGINGPGDEKQSDTAPPLVAGVAPDLTHLMTRGTFAGSIYNLYRDVQNTGLVDENGDNLGDDPFDVAAAGNPGDVFTGGRVDSEAVNRVDLEAWLRNPQAMKPMYAQGGRGMPNLGLSEDQIDQLVAFLETLN
jgi:cytochrome c oxidase subunit 2